MTRWTCPHCGCTSNHYSAQRLAFVCDACGTPMRDENAERNRMAYDRSIALARDNLAVGNWETCISQVSPLCSQRPSDPQLYLILLAAKTKNYSDFLIDNPTERQQASIYWDKLRSLHCVNNAMAQYSLRRRQELQRRRDKNNLRTARFAIYIGITLIVAGATITFVKVLSLLGIGGWIWWLISGYRHIPVFSPQSYWDNPFT